MKRVNVAFLLLALCGLMLFNLGTGEAGNPNYSITEYPSINTATVDGNWTTSEEWTDTPWTEMYDDVGNVVAKFGYNIQDFTNLGLEWIIEFFIDNTNDTDDYWQICFDNNNTGGAAPDSGDFKIEIVGHTTLKAYQGNGTGWTEVTPESGELTWANSISASPLNDTAHWILEIVELSKTTGVIQIPNPPPTGMRIAAYDASTGKLAEWAPNGSADNPDTWGLVSNFSMEPIPEGLNIGAIVLASLVAVTVGHYFGWKRPKSCKLTNRNA